MRHAFDFLDFRKLTIRGIDADCNTTAVGKSKRFFLRWYCPHVTITKVYTFVIKSQNKIRPFLFISWLVLKLDFKGIVHPKIKLTLKFQTCMNLRVSKWGIFIFGLKSSVKSIQSWTLKFLWISNFILNYVCGFFFGLDLLIWEGPWFRATSLTPHP